MRVYAASFYQTVRTGNNASPHMRITAANHIYPWILESFHYLDKDAGMEVGIRYHKNNVFVDSGAFSAFTLGATIDLKKYVTFLKNKKDIYHIASNIDVIGEHAEQATYDNQKKLEQMLGRGIICPVHHVRDEDYWLQRYLDEGYDYIFLGGMVPESVPILRQWLDHVWLKYLTHDDGTPKVKVHGFGLTVEELMFRYPWYSVDSTSWVLTSGFGIGLIDDPQPDGRIKRYRINFSEHSSYRYYEDAPHFWRLKPDEQEVIRRRLWELDKQRKWKADPQLEKDFKQVTGEQLAYTPEALSKSYGLRRVMDLDYFQRVADELRIDRFARVQETLF
jgi:hypothetical protein